MKRIQPPKIAVPQFLGDLFRDLRDRRLLLPAAALLIALVAVPVLLTTSGETAAPAPLAPLPSDGAEAVAPAVLAEQPGIRNYRERLKALKQQDPFKQQYADPAASDVAIEETPSTGSEITPTGTPSTATTDAATDAASTLPTSIPDTTPPATAPDTGVTEPAVEPAPEQKPPKPEPVFFTSRVDIAFGSPGEAKTYEGVRELDFIPNDKRLIAGYIGLAGNGDRAVFSLAPDVINTSGDGSCAPKKPNPCQFVRLSEGQGRRLELANGKTFVLRLLAAHVVPVADPR